jgi:predicted nucleic acid-binding Zn ribbon protein
MKKANDEPIGDVLKQMVKAFKLDQNLNKTKIENLWESQMGKSISTYTREITVKDHKLYVKIESASLRSELHYGREKILNLMNEALGENYLKEVIIS